MSREHAPSKQANAANQALKTSTRRSDASVQQPLELAAPLVVVDQVRNLQSRVGNRAVSAYLRQGNPALQRRLVQRIPDPPPVWNMPFELGQASNREQARRGLLGVLIRLSNIQDVMGEREGEGGVDPEARQALTDFFSETRNYAEQFDEEAPLTQLDAHNLNAYGQAVQQFYDRQLSLARQRLVDAVTPIAEVQAQDPSQLEEDLAERLHYAFIEGIPDQVAVVRDALDKIKEYNERVQQVADWGSTIAQNIRMARTAEVLGTIARGSESVGQVVTRVNQVLTAVRAVSTLTGVDNQAVGEAQNSINRFEQGLAVIDIAMSFADAIPLIGTLWSRYYYPVAQACIRMLRVIARADDRTVRDLTQLDWDEARARGAAPTIPRGAGSFFPGGQPLLDFMFAVMIDGGPVVTPTVEQFFLQHIELFNAGRSEREQMEQTGPHWYNPASWLEDNHIPNLLQWIQNHRAHVWAMLYGNMPVP